MQTVFFSKVLIIAIIIPKIPRRWSSDYHLRFVPKGFWVRHLPLPLTFKIKKQKIYVM